MEPLADRFRYAEFPCAHPRSFAVSLRGHRLIHRMNPFLGSHESPRASHNCGNSDYQEDRILHETGTEGYA
jgi:hypothetical protein